jgi:hypothetical protein
MRRPGENFLGIGGRAAFNVHPSIQLEAEMAYDFLAKRYADLQRWGLDGSGDIASPHAARISRTEVPDGTGSIPRFVTGKVGFENFSITNQNAGAGFTNTVGLTNGSTQFAICPGGGFEALAGPIGVRAEIGDDIYFVNRSHNNMRIGLGAQFRF